MIENSILILEDNPETAQLMKSFLVECNFTVDVHITVTDAISNIKFNHYDVILLDLNLPDFNGTEVLKFLNKNSITIPIIVVSAHSDKKTKLQAFKYGANDYMVKPIDLDELEARIWVQLNNSSQFSHKKEDHIFEIQNDNNILFKKQNLTLTKIELVILTTLIHNKNNLVHREELAQQLSSKANERSLDYHIRNIRKKIGENANPTYLITEYGLGYKLLY